MGGDVVRIRCFFLDAYNNMTRSRLSKRRKSYQRRRSSTRKSSVRRYRSPSEEYEVAQLKKMFVTLQTELKNRHNAHFEAIQGGEITHIEWKHPKHDLDLRTIRPDFSSAGGRSTVMERRDYLYGLFHPYVSGHLSIKINTFHISIDEFNAWVYPFMDLFKPFVISFKVYSHTRKDLDILPLERMLYKSKSIYESKSISVMILEDHDMPTYYPVMSPQFYRETFKKLIQLYNDTDFIVENTNLLSDIHSHCVKIIRELPVQEDVISCLSTLEKSNVLTDKALLGRMNAMLDKLNITVNTPTNAVGGVIPVDLPLHKIK